MRKWWDRQRTAVRASCPGCACDVATRMLNAYRVGGDGVSVVADKAGEVVRCCACGAVYTVLLDGNVLQAKRLGGQVAQAVAKQAVGRGARDGGGWGLDSDLETLSAQPDGL